MKELTIVLTLLLCCLLTNAQEVPRHPDKEEIKSFKKGQIDFTLYTSLVPLNTKQYGMFDLSGNNLTLDYGLSDHLSMGLFFGRSEESYQQNILFRHWTDVRINEFNRIGGLRILAHHSYFSKWDLYGGGMIGYNFGDKIYESESSELVQAMEDENKNKTVFTGILGFRYRLWNHLALDVEMAHYGKSILNVGVNFRM